MIRCWILLVALVFAQSGFGQENRSLQQRKGGGHGLPASDFRTQVPEHPLDMILGRPTLHSVTLSVLAYQELEGYVAYGNIKGEYSKATPRQTFHSGQPVHLLIEGLLPNTRYYYQLHSRPPGNGNLVAGPEYSFTTGKPAGSGFTFTIQADSHLDNGTSPDIYRQSLATVKASKPDFHIDLGDTFMDDKYAEFKASHAQYLAQRYYFGLVGTDSPVFLVLGNHDGESVDHGGAGPDSMAVWANTMRKKYFPNPLPDGFYSGNTSDQPYVGLLQDYYAWEWGDALFVVLDPFWYTSRKTRDGDNWPRTLGLQQYNWLKHTLESSHSKFKFVFIHHLSGGESREGRGGAEAARFFEWGGHELNGADTFLQNRPGWPMPIHQMLLRNKVSAVFHGHDHLYVKQDLDGIVYQEVPQPSHARGSTQSATEYGYKSGVLLPSSGIMRVDITPAKASVQYISSNPGSEGRVMHSYTIEPK